MAGKVIFKLKPAPTFTEEVEIPVPGAAPAKIGVTYHHKNREQRIDFFARAAEATQENEVELFMEVVAGWSGVDTEFSAEAVKLLFQNYEAAAGVILARYNAALIAGRRKN